jgi:hypothetical protein
MGIVRFALNLRRLFASWALRVRAYVPWNAAMAVAPGIDAIVRVPKFPGRGDSHRRRAAERLAHR